MTVGDVVQRPAELIAQMSAVAAARMNFGHVLSSCPVFRDFKPSDDRLHIWSMLSSAKAG
jgi:hypothetical protein